ncbi:hypothetical protein [Hungatella hominis]|uniref:Uncharacterized protein n=1 Tax=Hungatella hominis TaxID=2763050 RepID=A0ABR7H4P9_9FIRM|nr:hypothetical protein [Hungatella hominis]MBC5708170.1 hypothetical protein [Hungatella hominis]
MNDKIKTALSSEKSMTVINLLFLLSLFIRNRGIIFIAYIAWIVFLICFIKKTSSKAVRAANGIFLIFAVAMIVINLYFMISYR